MKKKALSSEQKFLRNFLIGFFSVLFIVLISAFIALFQTLISYPDESSTQQTTIIENCYDGDTCTTTEGEKIRLACIDTPELRGEKADPIPAKAARDYLNELVAGKEVEIRRITKDRYGRTVAELFQEGLNVQRLLVSKGYAQIYERYAEQCSWARKGEINALFAIWILKER